MGLLGQVFGNWHSWEPGYIWCYLGLSLELCISGNAGYLNLLGLLRLRLELGIAGNPGYGSMGRPLMLHGRPLDFCISGNSDLVLRGG